MMRFAWTDIKEQNRMVAGWIINIDDYRRELEKHQLDIAACSKEIAELERQMAAGEVTHQSGERVGTSYELSDPTYRDAAAIIRMLPARIAAVKVEMENIRGHAEPILRIIQLVEDVEASFSQSQAVLVNLRRRYRFQRNRTGGWMVMVQQRYALEMAKLTGAKQEAVWRSERALRQDMQAIIDCAVRMAIRRGMA
jgi:hypothetical protein